jgi:hypothetical protein
LRAAVYADVIEAAVTGAGIAEDLYEHDIEYFRRLFGDEMTVPENIRQFLDYDDHELARGTFQWTAALLGSLMKSPS